MLRSALDNSMNNFSDLILPYLPWLVTYGLLLCGLVAAFVPVIPSHLLILISGGAHYFLFREESGLGIVSFIVLVLLLVGSQTFETMSGSIGSKWFGGTKWGTIGAMAGLIVGMFFPPLGFVIGPLVGALLLEAILAKKNIKDATQSGLGSAVGTLTGLLVRMIVAFVMATYLLLDIYLLK